MTTIGSVCTGYGGLDAAVQAVFGGEVAWVADIDPGASLILARRFPSVPNLGDITIVDWADVEPVDIFCAGFPCQPVSAAGRRKGVSDERWLWDDIAQAIGRMVTRPRLLVLENVPGLLSANRGDAMARVVSGLAALGYEFAYRLVRASDVGAPHKRERWFCLAWLAADADRPGEGRRELPSWRPGPGRRPSGGGQVPPDPECERREGCQPAGGTGAVRAVPETGRRGPAGSGRAAAHPDSPASGERRESAPGQAEGWRPRADAGRRGGAPAAHPECHARAEDEQDGPAAARHRDAAAHSQGYGRDEGRPEPARIIGRPDAALGGDGAASDAHDSRRGAGEHGVPPQESDPGRGAPADAERRTPSAVT